MALIQCPECGNTISDKASTCPKCGYPLINLQVTCPECQSTVDAKATVCPECGYPLKEPDNSASTEQVTTAKPSENDGAGCLFQALSFLIPILGFILGFSYISSGKRNCGKDLIYLALGGVMLNAFAVIIISLIRYFS